MTLLTTSARRRSGGYPLPASGVTVSVPTYDGSGQSIHPSVVDMGQRWNGYRWWFADTPYPWENDKFENPSIFASNDRANWVVPAGLSNPIAPAPSSGFNSDIDLVWDPDEERLVVYWRDYRASRTPDMLLRTMWSTNGVEWHESTAYEMTQPRLSPAVCRVGVGDWRLWRFGNAEPPGMWTGPTSLGPWTFAGTVSLTGAVPSRVWHGDIIRHPSGQWMAIFSNTSITHPAAVSDDGLSWHVGASFGFRSYRATMCVSTEPGMIDVWGSVGGQQRVDYHRRPEATWLDLAAGLP